MSYAPPGRHPPGQIQRHTSAMNWGVCACVAGVATSLTPVASGITLDMRLHGLVPWPWGFGGFATSGYSQNYYRTSTRTQTYNGTVLDKVQNQMGSAMPAFSSRFNPANNTTTLGFPTNNTTNIIGDGSQATAAWLAAISAASVIPSNYFVFESTDGYWDYYTCHWYYLVSDFGTGGVHTVISDADNYFKTTVHVKRYEYVQTGQVVRTGHSTSEFVKPAFPNSPPATLLEAERVFILEDEAVLTDRWGTYLDAVALANSLCLKRDILVFPDLQVPPASLNYSYFYVFVNLEDGTQPQVAGNYQSVPDLQSKLAALSTGNPRCSQGVSLSTAEVGGVVDSSSSFYMQVAFVGGVMQSGTSYTVKYHRTESSSIPGNSTGDFTIGTYVTNEQFAYLCTDTPGYGIVFSV